MSSVSVVVPAYNEEDIIQDTLDHLDDVEEYLDEVYLVDDGSTDRTDELIHEFYQKNDTDIKALSMIENANKVGAVEEAVRHSDTDYVILSDADTRLTNPEDIETAVDEISENGYGAMAMEVSPDYSEEGITGWIKNGLQDFEYSLGRQIWQLTTSEKARITRS